MIEYDLKKNNNKKNVKAYGKYYAKPHVSETVDLDELADHMHGHNSPFSAGTIKGILIDAVTHSKHPTPIAIQLHPQCLLGIQSILRNWTFLIFKQV